MAVLDRFLNVMFDKDARAVVLETGKQVLLQIDDDRHPVTKDPVNTPKILHLVKEIMPAGMQPELDGGEGRLRFDYLLNDHRVDAEIDRVGENVTVVLSPAKPRRSSAAISVPAETLLMESPATAVAPSGAEAGARGSTARTTEVSARAEERIQDLLRYLVESDSSDLHLRVDLPPTVRTHGELLPFPIRAI